MLLAMAGVVRPQAQAFDVAARDLQDQGPGTRRVALWHLLPGHQERAAGVPDGARRAGGVRNRGFYVVGLTALGAFRPGRSDVDFVAVLGDRLPVVELNRLRRAQRRLYAADLAHTVLRPPWRWPLTCNGVFVRWADLGRSPLTAVPIASHSALRFAAGAGFDVNPVTWRVLASTESPSEAQPPTAWTSIIVKGMLFSRSALIVAMLIALGGMFLAIGHRPSGSRSIAFQVTATPTAVTAIPGPVIDPVPAPSPSGGVYASITKSSLPAVVSDVPARVYVPNNGSNTVDVVDPATFEVVAHYAVGQGPHHIAPAWDLSELYVDNELSSTLTVIDIHTGYPSRTIPVQRPYNLYFTPDGQKAIVVAEAFDRLDFYDPHTWQLLKPVPVRLPGHPGVDHLDFSADGSYLLASTEFTGQLVKVDVETMEVIGNVDLGGLPVDVRLAPDGTVFYVTNQGRNGVSIIDPVALQEVGFIATGRGAHGLQVSRDAGSLYVSNRLEGTISVIDLASRQVAATWRIGGSPDMMQLSPDGTELWTTGRFDSAVYVVDTRSGQLMHSIRVGAQPHGLTYFPNPGRYSLGHNGMYR